MKKLLGTLLLILAGSCTLAPAPAAEPAKNPDGSMTLVLPAEVVKACEAEGGCRIVSKEQLLEWAKQLVAKMCGREI